MSHKPSSTHRIAARSIPEVVEAVDGLVARIGNRRTLTFGGRKFSKEAFINAMAMYVLDQPQDEQERLLAKGLSRYEALLNKVSEIEEKSTADRDTSGSMTEPKSVDCEQAIWLPDPPTTSTEQPAPCDLPLPGHGVRVSAREGKMPLPDPPILR